MVRISDSPHLMARIPVPEDYEEVEAQQKINIPNQAPVIVTVKILRKKRGISPMERKFGAHKAFKKPVAIPVAKKKSEPKVKKTKISVKAKAGRKTTSLKTNKSAVRRGKPKGVVLNRPRCSWCGGSVSKPGQVHEQCAEAVARVEKANKK